MTRPRIAKKRRNAVAAGMGSITIAGTGSVNRILRYALPVDPFAVDAANLHGDFARALDTADRRAKIHR